MEGIADAGIGVGTGVGNADLASSGSGLQRDSSGYAVDPIPVAGSASVVGSVPDSVAGAAHDAGNILVSDTVLAPVAAPLPAKAPPLPISAVSGL